MDKKRLHSLCILQLQTPDWQWFGSGGSGFTTTETTTAMRNSEKRIKRIKKME